MSDIVTINKVLFIYKNHFDQGCVTAKEDLMT